MGNRAAAGAAAASRPAWDAYQRPACTAAELSAADAPRHACTPRAPAGPPAPTHPQQPQQCLGFVQHWAAKNGVDPALLRPASVALLTHTGGRCREQAEPAQRAVPDRHAPRAAAAKLRAAPHSAERRRLASPPSVSDSGLIGPPALQPGSAWRVGRHTHPALHMPRMQASTAAPTSQSTPLAGSAARAAWTPPTACVTGQPPRPAPRVACSAGRQAGA